jgi:hypothetical protein
MEMKLLYRYEKSLSIMEVKCHVSSLSVRKLDVNDKNGIQYQHLNLFTVQSPFLKTWNIVFVKPSIRFTVTVR